MVTAAHSCALWPDSTVSCLGTNGDCLLLDATTPSDPSTPIPLPGLSGIAQFHEDGGHACAVLVDGTLRCWGENLTGELGDGTEEYRATPTPVSSLTNVNYPKLVPLTAGAVRLASGPLHTCALHADGTVTCWGDNEYGQLGNGTLGIAADPALVIDLPPAVQITAGSSHTCIRANDGTPLCWGSNEAGQLGRGVLGARPNPTRVLF